MEHYSTGLSWSEYTFIRMLYEGDNKGKVKKFLDYEINQKSIDLDKLERENYIKFLEGEVFLRKKTIDFFSKKNDNPKTKALMIAESFRNIFPEGKKNNTYYWRSSVSTIVDKLTKFFKKYDYSTKEVLRAAKEYVDSFSPLEMDQGMMLSKYFIEKNGNSVLSEFLENSDTKEDYVENNNRI